MANTIVSYYDVMDPLVASFQFNHEMNGRNTLHHLFGNIAYQLACSNDDFKRHFIKAIEMRGTALTPQKQLQSFIIEPMSKTSRSSPAVIVIDGLDECGDESVRRDILKVIANKAPEMPDSIKIILTSRNEPDIRIKLETITCPVDINHVEGIEEDIQMYIEDRMKDIVKRLPEGWPGSVTRHSLSIARMGFLLGSHGFPIYRAERRSKESFGQRARL